MISKYAGTCRYCKKPTRANVDQYDMDTRTSYHEACKIEDENRLPTLDELSQQHSLAERLGYIHCGSIARPDQLLRRVLPADQQSRSDERVSSGGRDAYLSGAKTIGA